MNLIILNGDATGAQIQQGTSSSSQVSNKDDSCSLSLQASVLLFYAAESDGRLWTIETDCGTIYTAGKWQFNETNNRREEARFESALKQLEENGCMRYAGYPGEVFVVTEKGYMISDSFKQKNRVMADKPPFELLKELESGC